MPSDEAIVRARRFATPLARTTAGRFGLVERRFGFVERQRQGLDILRKGLIGETKEYYT